MTKKSQLKSQLRDLSTPPSISPNPANMNIRATANMIARRYAPAWLAFDEWADNNEWNRLDTSHIDSEVLKWLVQFSLLRTKYPVPSRLILDRDIPLRAFSEEVKHLILTWDPDCIFTLPEQVVTSQDVLYAIEQSIKKGGFTSPPSDNLDEMPKFLPMHTLTTPVIAALKKIGVTDQAITDAKLHHNGTQDLDEIKRLSGL